MAVVRLLGVFPRWRYLAWFITRPVPQREGWPGVVIVLVVGWMMEA